MIQNIFHFIYGLAPDFGGKPFNLVHYLAIKSAIAINKPDEVMFYYQFEPDTEWFTKIKPYLTLVKVSAPNNIYGNPLCHVAHQADVVRLAVLYQFGGIYMDLDTICTKPFTPLLENRMVMGLQLYPEGDYGLCNAVMLAEKGSKFIEKWFETYQMFRSPGRSEYWDEHSVRIPKVLADLYHQEIRIEPFDRFHFPSFSRSCIQKMFVENHSFENALCHHLWESHSWKYLSNLTIEQIMRHSTSYTSIARRYVNIDLPMMRKKSDPQVIADALNGFLKQLEVITPLSYLNQHYYSEDRKLLREYFDVRPFIKRIPGLYMVLSSLRQKCIRNRK